MNEILILIHTTLGKRFTRREFNTTIRKHSQTTHPEHYLQQLVNKGKIKHIGDGIYAR